MKRTPVPQWSQCEYTIRREARYWRPRFQRQLSVDDLMQEGWLVAHKVLRIYDPSRGAKMETLLTLSIRRHFSRLVKRVLMRAMIYNEQQRQRIDNWLRVSRYDVNPTNALRARLIIAKLEMMSREDQALALHLLETNGCVKAVAKRNHWSLPFTRERVKALRAVLREIA
jgi:hypothetical protein